MPCATLQRGIQTKSSGVCFSPLFGKRCAFHAAMKTPDHGIEKTSFSLHDRRVLVTGAGGGLGFTMARGLAEAGAVVIINDLSSERTMPAVEALIGAGHHATESVFDVTDQASIHAAFECLESEYGGVDILVNNAGIHRYGSLREMPLSDWQGVMDVNLTGAFLTAQTAVKGMVQRGRGVIINICSLMSEAGRPTTANYMAAKGGLKMLTKAMAIEWGPLGVRANGIGPGYILSDMTRHLAEEPTFDSWVKSRTPLGRWGDPADLVGPAVFLASDAARFINGHILYVDGGVLAGL